jgi:hypothetical protein
MSSVPYQENTARKRTPWRLAKTAISVLISLGLYLFANSFPFYTLFEPQSAGWVFWVSYANDLILPFAFYFFLYLGERWLKTWQIRALIALAIPILLEFGQLVYYRFSTDRYIGSFDPMDIVMYIISVGLAVIMEQMVFAKTLKFWKQ